MTLNQPSPDLLLVLQKEWNEYDETRESDLNHIKDWLNKEPHLPDTWDDGRLLTFLRGSSFSLEKCKQKLDAYFTLRNAAPEFYTDRDVNRPDIQEVFKLVQTTALPDLTSTGVRVCILRAMSKTAPAPNLQAAMKTIFMMADIRLAEEYSGVAGDIYIIDAGVDAYSYLAQFTPSLVKKYIFCLLEGYPIKVKGVHLINANSVIDTIISMFKPFLKEKIKNRIFLHSNMESLYEHVPREILPEEYGGNAGPTMDIHNAWVKKVNSYNEWFEEQKNVKADESRRPGKPKTHDDLFGIAGSFRQMSID